MIIDSRHIFEYLPILHFFSLTFPTVTISLRIISVCMTHEKIEREIVKFGNIFESCIIICLLLDSDRYPCKTIDIMTMVKHKCNGLRRVTPPQHDGVTHIDCLHRKRDRSKLKTSDGVHGSRYSA